MKFELLAPYKMLKWGTVPQKWVHMATLVSTYDAFSYVLSLSLSVFFLLLAWAKSSATLVKEFIAKSVAELFAQPNI